jgi:SpoVK/Ycf46/Vps4 family AAA+-type ATPase
MRGCTRSLRCLSGLITRPRAWRGRSFARGRHAIAGSRGEFQVHDSHVNQLLAEIDGVSGQRGRAS